MRRSDSIADLSFGRPPFGWVPGLGMRIVNFKLKFLIICFFKSEIRNPRSGTTLTPLLQGTKGGEANG